MFFVPGIVSWMLYIIIQAILHVAVHFYQNHLSLFVCLHSLHGNVHFFVDSLHGNVLLSRRRKGSLLAVVLEKKPIITDTHEKTNNLEVISMKKYTGNYTADAVKVLKNSDRLICRTDDDGMIYVTNGFTAYKMNPMEYASVVQPVTYCEAGNYAIQNGEKREEATFDLVKTFRESVKAADNTGDLALCPLVLTVDRKRTAAAYYNAEKDFVSLYDTRYISALCPGFTLRAPGSFAPAIAYSNGEPFALVLPIRPDENTIRAVKAYFTQTAGEDSGEAEQLRAELARLQDKLTRTETGAAALEERVQQQAYELEALRTAAEYNDTAEYKAPNEAQDSPADTKTAAEVIASRFSCMDGVTATIKGAHTTAPVVWLSGDTEKHADAIKAAGAKWSGKRSAFYVRVA